MSDMNMALIEEWRIYREVVENLVGRSLGDDEWNEFADEIKGRIDNYCNELYDDLVEQVRDGVFKPKLFDKFEDA